MKFQDKVLMTINKYNLIEKGDYIVIGVSGGPDSMALLHVLLNLKNILGISICVAHVNHMLREEASEETKYVQDYCKENEIECYVKKADVKEESLKSKMSLELVGRNVRYSFFDEVAYKVGANKIATAHNLNDNAETVLMNLIRGTGISGLKGIEKIRNNRYIRPIIECKRQEIELYCKENDLNPKYDKTNGDNIYTRNKIRNQLIPYLEEFNPNIISGLNRLSTIVEKEECFFNNLVEKTFIELQITGDNLIKNNKKIIYCNDNSLEETGNKEKEIILNLKKFNELDEVIKSRLIIYTINKLLGNAQGIEKIHVEDIIKLCGNNIGNKYLKPNKRIKVFVNKGKIFFIAVA